MKTLFIRIDDFWASLAQHAEFVAGILLVTGLCLLGLSWLWDIHSVTFDGQLQQAEILARREGGILARPVEKEVGYVLAPNWGLTGLVLLPLAVMHVLRARAAIEPLIRELIERKMLVDADLERLEADGVIHSWKMESTRWTMIALTVFLFMFLFVIFGDFIPVVAKWLWADPDAVARWSEGLLLQNDTYEFDWSIAATFRDAEISATKNLIFSSLAYLVIAMLGASFLISSFIWFISICAFFSPSGLERRGMTIVPDLESTDRRLGYEVFERFFDHLINACLFTCVIAVAMHLQNVYLRTPNYQNIFDMVFAQTFSDIRTHIGNLAIGAIVQSLTSTSDALEIPIREFSLQTFASAIALFLLSAIVFTCVWAWLRMSAKEGAQELRRKKNLDRESIRKIRKMKVWPLGWISVNALIVVIVVVGLCMWYVNFVSLVLVYFVVRAIVGLGQVLYTTVFPGKEAP